MYVRSERKSLIKCFRTARQSRNNQPRRQQWARQGSSPGKQQRVRVGSVAVNRFVEVPCWIEFTISRQKCTYKVHLARDITQMRCGRSLDIAVKISSQHDFDKLLLWLVIVVFFLWEILAILFVGILSQGRVTVDCVAVLQHLNMLNELDFDGKIADKFWNIFINFYNLKLAENNPHSFHVPLDRHTQILDTSMRQKTTPT